MKTDMKTGSNSEPQRGPLFTPSRDEIIRILDAMVFAPDDLGKSIRSKCFAVLEADPKWREPK